MSFSIIKTTLSPSPPPPPTHTHTHTPTHPHTHPPTHTHTPHNATPTCDTRHATRDTRDHATAGWPGWHARDTRLCYAFMLYSVFQKITTPAGTFLQTPPPPPSCCLLWLLDPAPPLASCWLAAWLGVGNPRIPVPESRRPESAIPNPLESRIQGIRESPPAPRLVRARAEGGGRGIHLLMLHAEMNLKCGNVLFIKNLR